MHGNYYLVFLKSWSSICFDDHAGLNFLFDFKMCTSHLPYLKNQTVNSLNSNSLLMLSYKA